MRILVSGASGFLGSALVPRLEASGHVVTRLVRRAATAPHEIPWDPARGRLESSALAGTEAVFHLSGEGLADGRWTPDRRQRLLASRVESTRLLAEAVARLDPRPQVMVSMSAVGFYGPHGDERVDESAPPAPGDFLSEVVRAWEREARGSRARRCPAPGRGWR